MEINSINDIVDFDCKDNNPLQIVENFIWVQEKCFGNEVTEQQKENILKLAQLLYYPNKENINVPVIANVPMGEGKSCLLVEFIKYLYDKDPNFGAIIVKKTLEECHDFCIDMGLTDKIVEEYAFDNDRKALKKAYYSYIDGEQVKLNKSEDYIGGQVGFIARTVRGFNFRDCKKYVDRSGSWWIGSPPPDAVHYDYRLCHDCNIPCAARASKVDCKKHRILAISHTRLFLSNYIDEFFDDILFFQSNGEEVKRKLLIIDEKIDMCDIASITDKNFRKLRELIIEKYDQYEELFSEINIYLNSLEYPEEMNKPVIKQKDFFRGGQGFEFDEDLLKGFYNDTTLKKETYESLIALGKILNSKNITTGIPYRFGDSKAKAERENRKLTREIYAYDYLDLAKYNEKFEKTVILDATAHLDYDYIKSNAIQVEDIRNNKRHLNVFIPAKDANTSKSKLLNTSNASMTAEARKAFYLENLKNLAMECKQIMEAESKKTLIVVFKEVIADRKYDFKEDYTEELKNIYKDSGYEVIHHGQFTTGVNKFFDCERLIIIGQLNKSSSFYENKCLAVGRNIAEDNTIIQNVSQTEINDYVISTIQQIGRTAYRKKELVDVYLISRLGIIHTLIREMNQYFNVNINKFNNVHYFQDPTKQELLIERILEECKGFKQGDTTKKRLIKDFCEEMGIDDSILRRDSFKEKLVDIGIRENPSNNREYIFTKDM